MRKALRPYVTAGVAVVGASALAVAPVIATPPDVKVVNPAVHQTASPLDTYVETVREALANLEALLGSALAIPAPTGWTLDRALKGLLGDPAGNVGRFTDEFGALGPLAAVSLPALLDNASAAVAAAIDRAEEGDYDLAVATLLRTYVSIVPVVSALVSAPLQLLGPDVAEVASVVLAKSLHAVAGPVLSGIGTTGVALQNVVDALDNAEPGSGALLGALLAAPGTVADGVVNGFALAPGPIALPGLLTPGDAVTPTKPNPGPVALATDLARGALSAPPAVSEVSVQDTDRVVALDADADPPPAIAETTNVGVDPDPDEATNANVMTDQDGPAAAKASEPRARLFGGTPAGRTGPPAGLSTLRQGIRENLRGLRAGIRDAVNSVIGRGDETERTSHSESEAP